WSRPSKTARLFTACRTRQRSSPTLPGPRCSLNTRAARSQTSKSATRLTRMSSTEELLKRLGVSIDAGTLRLALTHRSYAYENGGIPTNERLEFLGDSILGFSVTDSLYRDNPALPEGELAKRRSAVVSTRALAGIGRDLGIGEFIYLGQGERLTDGKNKSSILADTMEALIGATYLSNDIETARQLVMRLVGPLLKDAAALGAGTDWKTSMQELAASRQLGSIYYAVEGSGPDHARSF